MKTRLAAFVAIATCAIAMAFAVPGVARAATTTTKTGWISDSMCGAKGASASHKDCALKCVKDKSAKYVFVDAKSKTVYAIKNQDAIKPDDDLGKEVKVTATYAGKKTLDIEKVAPTM